MTATALRTNFGEHENAPVVQDAVLGYVDQLASSFTLRDIYRPLGLPRMHVQRVLGRLHAKGVLTRYKIPVQIHRYDRRTQSIVSGGATRQCFLYQFADEVEDC